MNIWQLTEKRSVILSYSEKQEKLDRGFGMAYILIEGYAQAKAATN